MLDLGAGVVEQRRHVGAGQVGRVEQGEDPSERGSQLVRDGGREAHPELVERRLVAAPGRSPRLRFGLAVVSSPDRHHSDTCSEPAIELS